MRRTWMLLLVTVLLTVFLAVPAMAADCCGDANHCVTCAGETHAEEDGWIPISEAELTVNEKGYYVLSTGGKYYIDDAACVDNVYTKGILISAKIADPITICLNGKTWTGDTSTENLPAEVNNKVINRPLSITAQCTINIVDCFAVTDGVTAGKIQGVSHADNGGTILVHNTNAIVNIYAGTIEGGTVTGGKNGGNIYNIGTVNIYGGVISGGTAVENASGTGGLGGNIYSNGTLKLEAGLVSGGEAYQGGNIYNAGGSITIGEEVETETDALNQTVKVTDGYAYRSVTTGTAYHAGNIYSSGTMTMYYGTISGGKAQGQAGNVRSNGTFYMHGGVIRDGTNSVTATSAGSATAGNANVWVQSANGKLIMDGGHIYGYTSFYGTGAEALQLSGKAKLYAPDSDGDGLSDGGVAAIAWPVITGELDAEAKIAILNNSDKTTITYDVDSTLNYTGIAEDWLGYINHQIVGFNTTEKINNVNTDTSFWWTVQDVEGTPTIVKQTETGTNRWHCVCGANAGEAHIGDCNTYDVQWTQYSMTANKELPNPNSNDALYYYLVDNDDTADNTITWTGQKTLGSIDSGNQDAYTRNIFVDFNGVTIKATSNIRMLVIGSDFGTQKFTFTDSSQGHTGGFDSDSQNVSQGGMVWIRKYLATHTDRKADWPHVIKMYRLNLDASGLANSNNGSCVEIDTGSLYLYDVDLKGGRTKTTANYQGGAIYITSGTTVEVHGGTITGGTASQYGGAIYNAGNLTLDGGVEVTGGNAVLGGAVYQHTTGRTDLKKGTITGGVSTGNGGNVHIAGGTFNMGVQNVEVTDELNESVKITDGWASTSDKHGGNVYLSGGTMNMYYGTISGGKAQGQAGNIRINSTFNMYEGVITGGRCSVTNSSAGNATHNNANVWVIGASAKLNMSGGRIDGYTYGFKNGNAIPTVKLSGSAKIYADGGKGLILSDGVTVTVENLSSGAKVGITSMSTAEEVALTAAITDSSVLTGLFSDAATYKLALKDDNILYRVSADTVMGAVVNEGGIMLPLPKAVAVASGTNDFVRMLSDYTGEQLVISKSLNLDLNGKKIVNGLKLTGGTLKLADSANYAYTDEGNRVTITTSGEGAIGRAFITGNMTNYGSNHRYLVLKHEDGTYSSHRIYLAAQNPVLFPASASISFRTMMICDETVAGYIDTYGIAATGTGEEIRVPYKTEVLPFGALQNQNSRVAGVVNILTGGDDDQERAETNLTAYAYIHVNDYFGDDGEITSAKKSANLKQVVQNADKATLTSSQQIAMADMYAKYLSVMGSWGLTQIPEISVDFTTIERHCLCGDPNSTNNPCAAKGHAQLDWQPLPEAYYKTEVDGATNQWKEGNYYLPGDIALEKQPTIVADNMVCLDLNGHSITSKAASRLANVYGVFNLSNSQMATKESVISMSCPSGGNGGLLIMTSGNVSLYKGVTLQAASTDPAVHQIRRGLVEANGSLNIYGAKLMGTTLLDNGGGTDMRGGAVYVGGNGYLFINDGIIQAGNDNERGGAIYISGGHTYIKGDAQIIGGTGTYSGGLIYIAAGEVNVTGVSLTGTEADYGAAVTMIGGTLNLNGTVTMDGETATYDTVITGGAADKGGAVFVSDGTLNVNGAKIVGGTANSYETTETVDEVETTVTNPGLGGAIFAEGGNVNLSNNAMVDGGTADKGGAVFIAGATFEMKSSTVQNGKVIVDDAKQNGKGANFCIASGELKILEGSVVKGGYTSRYVEGNDNFGGSALYAGGGTITVKDSELLGYTASKLFKRGGTIFNNGGTITIEDTTVVAAYTGNNGTALLNLSGTFTMNGDSVLDASANPKVAYGGAVVNHATFIMNDGEIIGCAAGYTNHGGGAVHSTRTFTMNGGTIRGGSTADTATSNYTNLGGNVRVSSGTFTMNGGSIEGGAATGTASLGGGNVAITGGTFTMTGGTISGGTSSTNGGNVLVTGGNFKMTGGTIENGNGAMTYEEMTTGTAEKGGNVYIAGGAFSLESGTVSGGRAYHAGAIYVAGDATLNIGKADTQENEELNQATKITGAHCGHNGGGIYVAANGTVNMYYGTIENNKAANVAGNVRTDGTWNMFGGVIKDGAEKATSLTAAGAANNSTSNLQVTNGHLNVSGGHIHGCINTYTNEKLITVSGSAKIYKEDDSGNIISGITLSTTGDAKLMVGQLNSDAKIAVTKTVDNIVIEAADGTPEYDATDLNAVAQYIQAGQIVPWGSVQLTYEAADAEAEKVEAIYTRAADAHYNCICGANIGEEHLGDCDGYDVLFTEWALGTSGKTALPNPATSEATYYYLTDGDGTADNTYELLKQNTIGAGNSKNAETGEITVNDKVEGGRNVYIDFNGVTLTTGEAFNSTGDGVGEPRMLAIASGKAAQHVTLLDSSEGHSGGLVAGQIKRADHSNVFWMRNAYEENQDHHVEMYRINLDGSAVRNSTGNVGINVSRGTLKMYEVNLTGGTVSNVNDHGGALTVSEGTTVEVYGGTITGGTTSGRAGGIYVLGDLTMKDVTVTGGTAKIGGNIFVTATGKLDMENCIVKDGKTNLSGGSNIFIYGGEVTMKGGSITGGEAWVENGAEASDLTERKAGVGGGVYLDSGEFKVSGDAVIENNYAYGYTIDTKTSSVFDDIYVSDKSDKFVSNLYLNGNAVTDAGLTSGASIGFSMLEADETDNAYQGVFALSASNSGAYFKPDNASAVSGKTLGYGDGKLYYGVGDTSTYLVGYGAASIQPTKKDLVTGMVLTGYGNTAQRTTDKLYTDDNTTNDGYLSTVADYKNISGLKATALAITDGQGETVIIMSTDAVSSMSNELARKLIAQATGVPLDNITISACHQHSTPECKTVYYTTTNAEGKTVYADAQGNALAEGADPVIKTDYRRTYLAGVVDAAVAAYENRKQATVSAGILDTTNDGTVQYNFVRNVTIKVKKDYTHTYTGISQGETKSLTIKYLAGEGYNNTDGHNGIEAGLFKSIKAAYATEEANRTDAQKTLVESFDIDYESKVDTTMQLVKFERDGEKPIVLANFQTHPHMAAGADSQHVHADVVGAFRYYLETNYTADVLYFSGAGGNVNTGAKLNDGSLSPVNGMSGSTDANRMAKADTYGSSLATLAKSFMDVSSNMTAITNAKDVNVSKTTVTYELQAFDASDEAVQNIINNNIVDWENGGYIEDPTTFTANHWYDLCGKYSYADYGDAAESHRVYHAYDATNLRAKYLRQQNGETSGEMTVMAYNIGGIGFVQAPYEMFQESGQAIKGNVTGSEYVSTGTNPFDITIIASQANSSNGYIPTPIAYENGGGYSSTDNCKYAKGTAETLVETYVEMLNGMYK